MATGINNTVSQTGLMSTNPFIAQGAKTGGTTTPGIAPLQSGTVQTQWGPTSGTTPSTTGFQSSPTGGIMATTSSTPKPSPGLVSLDPTPTKTAPPIMGATGSSGNSGGQIDYTLHNGESVDAYNSRIAASRQSSVVPPSVTPPPSTNPNTAQAPAFSGIVGALANQSSQPTPAYNQAQANAQTATTGLINSGNTQSPEYTAAMAAAQKEQQNLQASYQNEAQALGDNANNPIPLEFQQGRAAVLQNQYLNQQAGFQAGFQGQAALAGAATGQQSAQQQGFSSAGSVANSAAGAATSQQGTQISGLGAAGGLAQPSYLAPGQSPYSPTTGQYGQIAGTQGGGIAAVGGIQQQIAQGGAVQQMTGQQAQAQALGTNLNQLIQSAGINPNDAGALTTFANGVNQWINNQSGDPKYQNFANLINEISSRYASILNQAGGTPTDQSTISHSIINGLASGKDIQTVLASLDKNASDSIGALKGASGSNSASGAGSVSAGGYNFVQNAQGQWVAK